MGTTAQKLQYLAGTKQAIKQALTDNGISVPTGTTFREYASKITDIRSKFSFEPLPYTQVSLGGTSVNVSPNINIAADDGNFYTPLEWSELSGKGVTVHPIGFEIEAVGEHFVMYFMNFAQDANKYTYKDVTGQFSQTDGQLQHSMYNYNTITDAGSWNDTVDGATKQAKATVSGNIITLTTTNSPFSWQISTDCGNRNAFQDIIDKSDARTQSLYAQCEWLRNRFAIDSGLTTEEPDGTIGTVTIVKSGGNLYFAVNGVATSKLAKYNVHTAATAANLTSIISDYIYQQQLANNVNMNDQTIDGVAPSAHILTPGAKGAEAYAFNGKWMITTPIITNCSNAPTNMEKNIPDAPAVYYVEKVTKPILLNKVAPQISLPSEKMVQGYYLNRTTILNSYTSFLNSAAGGSCNVPSTITAVVWCAARNSAVNAWYVGTGGGGMFGYSVVSRYAVLSASALS